MDLRLHRTAGAGDARATPRRGAALALAMLCLASAVALAQQRQSYLCTADKIAGFSWDGQDWVVTDFATHGEQFLVRPASPPDWVAEIFSYDISYAVTVGDSSEPQFWCGRATHDGQLSPIIACGGSGHGFRLNVESLRFMVNYGLGYLDGRDGDYTTPHLTIGTCALAD